MAPVLRGPIIVAPTVRIWELVRITTVPCGTAVTRNVLMPPQNLPWLGADAPDPFSKETSFGLSQAPTRVMFRATFPGKFPPVP